MVTNNSQPIVCRMYTTSAADNPADQRRAGAGDIGRAQSSRGSAAGELSRGRRRTRDADGGTEQENGNESDMDLELLVESESESDDEGGVAPGEDRVRRPTAAEYNPGRPADDVCVVSRRVLYSEDDSSSGDEEMEENELDQVEEEEEMEGDEEDEGVGREESTSLASRILHSARVRQSELAFELVIIGDHLVHIMIPRICLSYSHLSFSLFQIARPTTRRMQCTGHYPVRSCQGGRAPRVVCHPR